MQEWLSEALAEQREIPLPSGELPKAKPASTYSGPFLLRMPGELHEQLARAAEEKQVSLNRFLTDVLTARVSPARPQDPPFRPRRSSRY